MAMIDIKEEDLRFCFDEKRWTFVIKHDETKEYSAYKKFLHSKDESLSPKAVDILAVLDSNLYMIEVKDFRNRPGKEGNREIVNKERLGNGASALMQEVALKVKETVACIVGVKNLDDKNNNDYYQSYFKHLAKPPKVIAWLEMTFPDQNRRKSAYSEYQEKI